jgi:hypothetical protein
MKELGTSSLLAPASYVVSSFDQMTGSPVCPRLYGEAVLSLAPAEEDCELEWCGSIKAVESRIADAVFGTARCATSRQRVRSRALMVCTSVNLPLRIVCLLTGEQNPDCKPVTFQGSRSRTAAILAGLWQFKPAHLSSMGEGQMAC